VVLVGAVQLGGRMKKEDYQHYLKASPLAFPITH